MSIDFISECFVSSVFTFPGNIKESVVTVYDNTKWFTRRPVSDKEWVYAATGEQGDNGLLTHYRNNSEFELLWIDYACTLPFKIIKIRCSTFHCSFVNNPFLFCVGETTADIPL